MVAVSLARVLLDSGLLDVAWLGKATAIASEADVPVCHALTRWKLLEARALAKALSQATGLPVVDVDGEAGGQRGPPCAPMQRAACQRLRVLPLAVAGGTLTLGMTDPTDDDAVRQVEAALQLRVHRVLVDDDALERALRRMFPKPADEIRAAPWGMPLVTSSEPPSSLSRTPSGAFGKVVASPASPASSPAPSQASARVPSGSLGKPPSPPPTPTPSLAVAAPPAQNTQLVGVPVVVGEASGDGRSALPSLQAESRSGAGGPPVSGPSGPEMFLFTPTETPTPPLYPTTSSPARAASGAAASGFEESSGVFTSNTIENGVLPMVTLEATGPVPRFDGRGRGASTVVAGAALLMTDEAPTLQNDLLGMMRLLIAIDDKAAGDALVGSFGMRVKDLCVVPLQRATDELGKRRFDVVVVVEPKNTIASSQQVAALAARAKGGVTVVTSVADFARLPGVKGIVDPPPKGGLPAVIEKVLAARAHG